MKRKQKRGAKLLEEKAERYLADTSSLPAQIAIIKLGFRVIWVYASPIPGTCTHFSLPQDGSGAQEGFLASARCGSLTHFPPQVKAQLKMGQQQTWALCAAFT